jgi:hypothetical protein
LSERALSKEDYEEIRKIVSQEVRAALVDLIKGVGGILRQAKEAQEQKAGKKT